MRLFALILFCLIIPISLHAEEIRVPTAIAGDALSINNQKMELGAAQWANPERNWRTVGELIKTTLPPPNAIGQRPNVLLVVNVDEKAQWGALKTLLMAAAAHGIPKAQLNYGAPGNKAFVDLPGSKSKGGEVVDFPLFPGAGSTLQTENGGKKMNCTPNLIKGLIGQLPKATINVKATLDLSAAGVVNVLDLLAQHKAAGIAFLPVEDLTLKDVLDRKEAKDSVDRAFEGGLGGLGK